MECSQIYQILSAPISHFMTSTEAEKALFPDKKGWFYTIGLASGQRFVAHMDSKDDVVNTYTLRPLIPLLPDLKEIQWTESVLLGGHGVGTVCRLSEGVSEAEKREYESALEPKQENMRLLFQPLVQTVYVEHPLLERLRKVHSLRLLCEENKRNLLVSQERLRSLEVSDKQQPVQQLLNLKFER